MTNERAAELVERVNYLRKMAVAVKFTSASMGAKNPAVKIPSQQTESFKRWNKTPFKPHNRFENLQDDDLADK